ncbi:MAG: RES domain-containing protein [Deltaproteobacteria bacterium]|jgi:hypothetical protein|nr:RES domain-containing protein [Deltaproteobacteria bacterium]
MDQGKIGDCDYCSHKKVYVYDISKTPNPISDAIIGLVQTYSVSDFPGAKPLKMAINDDWDIFSPGSAMVQTLLVDLCGSVISPDSDILTRKVVISQLLDHDFLREFGVVRGFSWEQFAESIKHENRFHSGMFNVDTFASFLSIISKPYSAGSTFYRARISQSSLGYQLHDMGAPPREKRSAGLINPEGIGVLYLSSSKETALNEVRATTFDFVSVGTFESDRDIKVVNLSGISGTSPFLYQGELERYAANRKVFQDISFEIAKPLRRSERQIEYLPTQYISEFIKSQGYDGVEYASTLHAGGYNIAIFDEKQFRCANVETVEINKIIYSFKSVLNALYDQYS